MLVRHGCAATITRPCACLQASIVPALAGLLLTPLLMYKLFAPEIKDTPEAPKASCVNAARCEREQGRRCDGWPLPALQPAWGLGHMSVCPARPPASCRRGPPVWSQTEPRQRCLAAWPIVLGFLVRRPRPRSPLLPSFLIDQSLQLAAERLTKMGPMSRDEKIMLGTMAAAVCLWVAGDSLGISAVTTAMLGLCVLLSTGVLQWKECLAYPAAWDTVGVGGWVGRRRGRVVRVLPQRAGPAEALLVCLAVQSAASSAPRAPLADRQQ